MSKLSIKPRKKNPVSHKRAARSTTTDQAIMKRGVRQMMRRYASVFKSLAGK